ncbi:helix-turn-helix domain-containing protein [Lacibacter sp. H375]|uniref:helix-turn-helix domain-containing protein n=1 Tax=Lacibacter sp. H375 TaxID=3133424 RepID=UPI0030BCFC91
MPQSFTNLSVQKTALKAILSQPAYCLKDYQLEEGLILRHMLLNDPDAESFGFLLSANIKDNDYFFAYCPNDETGKQLSAYYNTNYEGPVKRFFYSEFAHKETPVSQKEIFVFIINSNWIKSNYNCSADAFAAYIDMLPILFNIADNPTLMKIDMLYYLKAIKEITQQNEHVNILRLRVNVLSLIEKFFSSADFSAFNAATPKKYSYTKEMHDLGARLSMFLKSNLPDLIIFAREYNMSLSSLKRHFKNVHGKPIYEYYLEQKMMLARNIIQDSRRSVAQVAYELGYEDPNCLIKSFKKVYGVPPGKICA